MTYDIGNQLAQAYQKAARLHKIDAMLEQLRSEQKDLKQQKRELAEILVKETGDVRKLEGKSLAALFYTVLGKLDERVDKEKEEELAARLKYDQAGQDLQDIREQIERLEAERPAYAESEQEFAALYQQRQAELLQGNDLMARQLFALTEETKRLKIKLQEIEEATLAGEEALDNLGRVRKRLDSAHSWGTFDLLGGGLLSGLAKHSHIDEAKELMGEAQHLLRRFSAELADIEMGADFAVSTQGFAKFADFFFDGLISDWYMQSQITHSMDSVFEAEDQVTEVMERLRQIKAQGEYELEEQEKAMQKLVMAGE